MSDRRADDALTDDLLADIRNTADTQPDTFTRIVEGALTESLAGRYDGSYPPAGHTYPTT
ncbi:hypothetical protein ACFC26_16090 [Kitasatospora purpeofusca]|uniref:hypothetical protein n=1 Tax=Kitasatospora purpeofusca TaxID=67352 RepID=UPI0035DD6E50